MTGGGKSGGRGGRAGRGGHPGGAGRGSGRGRRLFGVSGRGGDMGRGSGLGGPGGMGKHGAAGPDSDCICPNCDYRERHVLGRPCDQRKCPKCGRRMARNEKADEGEAGGKGGGK